MSSELVFTYVNHSFDEQEAERMQIHSLHELVMEGYSLQGDADYASFQFRNEYTDGEDSRIFIASIDHQAVASISFDKVENFAPNLSVYSIRGVACLERMRGIGLGKRLYALGVQHLGIDALIGSTKTPSAVLARASATRDLGMRTFYGGMEVTSEARSGILVSI